MRCGTYARGEVEAAIRKSVDDLGGIRCFVSAGERVLLKPNMLAARRPDEAITTHPEVLRAVIRMVRDAGGVPVVGDSPAGRATERILRNLAEKTGIAGVCREEGVDFALFLEYDTVAYPDGKVARSFPLARTLSMVDAVISLPKLKTHSLTGFTGAVKNCFGLVHGLKKAEYHLRMKTPEAFSEMLVDLVGCVAPRLTIMDGVQGMEGDGPSAGEARILGVVLASSDPHALDLVAARIVGSGPDEIWTLRCAEQRGLLPADGGVEVVGPGVDEVRAEGFRMPPVTRVYGRTPGVLGRFASEGLARKPVFDASTCIGCGACVDICAAKALTRDGHVVTVDRDACIRCYCCHEVCPAKAIALKRMPLRSWGRTLISPLMRHGHRTHSSNEG